MVFSRKLGEEVMIGDDIRLKVVAIRGNQVRLGFSAPPQVLIQRQELGPTADRPHVVRPADADGEP